MRRSHPNTEQVTERESTLWPAHGGVTGPGYVGKHSARIWVKTRTSGKHRFEWHAEGGKPAEVSVHLSPDQNAGDITSFLYPDDCRHAQPLPPGSRIRYELLDDQGSLGRGRFDTAPEWRPFAYEHAAQNVAPFSIAFFSCHQPFDETGALHPRSMKALERLPGVLEEYGVRRVIGLGDQMYTDLPEERSLFDPEFFQKISGKSAGTLLDCTEDEVREFLRGWYARSYEVQGFSQMLANWATTMICDDHEFVDNFGSAPEHSRETWRSVREGALNAAFDYEALRQQPPGSSRPRSFHFSWEYGPVACFIMDLRSQRRATQNELRFFEDEQLDELRDYLVAQKDRPLLVLGLSVPLAFSPEALIAAGIAFDGEGSDPAERWWNEKAEKNRKDLVALLREHRKRHPEQAMLLVGGDVHAGMVSRIDFEDCHAYQLISSALSNRESAFSRAVAETIPRLGPWSNEQVNWDLLPNQINGNEGANPYADLNIGILSISPERDGRIRAVTRIIGLAEEDGPRVVFESEPLRGRSS